MLQYLHTCGEVFASMASVVGNEDITVVFVDLQFAPRALSNVSFYGTSMTENL